jgi:hypothetical protein
MATLLGCFVGNPNGNDPTANAGFDAALAAHVLTIGKAAACMNAFCSDGGAGWGAAAASPPVQQMQWTAWSWAQDANAKALVPVVGVPMVFSGGNPAPQIYIDIANGMYDFVWNGIAQAWAANGFKLMYARIGWEFNGTWYPWSVGHLDAAGLAAWLAAWNHIAKVFKSVTGIVVKTVWNPDSINWAQYDATTQCYPGDAAVDVIGLDIYSTLYPINSGKLANGQPAYFDWALNNWTLNDLPTWLAKAINREHAWDWPGSNGWNQTQNNNACGMQQLLGFAAARGKPFAIPECGSGIDPNHPANGLADDGDFPIYLANRLFGRAGAATASVKPLVAVEFVNVWDTNVGDGSWQFYKAPATIALKGTLTFNGDGTTTIAMPAFSSVLKPTSQPNAAAAWAKFAAAA